MPTPQRHEYVSPHASVAYAGHVERAIEDHVRRDFISCANNIALGLHWGITPQGDWYWEKVVDRLFAGETQLTAMRQLRELLGPRVGDPEPVKKHIFERPTPKRIHPRYPHRRDV